MQKIKACAGILKDLERFYSFTAEEKYEEIIEPKKKGLQFPK